MKPPRGANGNKIQEGNNTGRQRKNKLKQSQVMGQSATVEFMEKVGTLGTVCNQSHVVGATENKRGKCYKNYKKNYKTKYVESNCSIFRNTNYLECGWMERRTRRMEQWKKQRGRYSNVVVKSRIRSAEVWRENRAESFRSWVQSGVYWRKAGSRVIGVGQECSQG